MNGRQPSAWYASTSSSAPASAHASASAGSPGTMRESSKSTAETSTALAPGASRGQPLGERLHRPGREPDDLEPLLPQPPELAPQRVELAVGRDELRPLPQRQRGQEPQHELVRVRSERDRRAGVVEQPPHPVAQPLRLRERPLPLEVRVLGRVLPRLELPLAPDVGPRLVRVAGQQQPLGDAELRVVLRERVQSSLRTAQRSGKNGLCSVERRYSAP